MGLTRQSVQRLSDLLVKEKLAMYQANPVHARSPHLRVTPRGQATLRTLRRIIERLERTPAVPFTRRSRRGQP